MKRYLSLLALSVILIVSAAVSSASYYYQNPSSFILNLDTSATNSLEYYITTFQHDAVTNDSSETFIWTAAGSKYIYLTIPKYASITNASLQSQNQNMITNITLGIPPGPPGYGWSEYESTSAVESDPAYAWCTGNNLCNAYAGIESGTNNYRAYLKFNNSKIPSSVVVLEAIVTLEPTDIVNGGGNVNLYHVTEQTWLDQTLTWNNQPCGTAFNNAANCNLTSYSTKSMTSITTWYNTSVKAAIDNDITNARTNTSFALKIPTETDNYAVSTGIYNYAFVEVKYAPTYPLNTTFTIASDDNETLWTIETTQAIDLNITAVNTFLNTCEADPYGNCNLTVKLYANSSATLALSNLNVTFQPKNTNITQHITWSNQSLYYLIEQNTTFLAPNITVSKVYLLNTTAITTAYWDNVTYAYSCNAIGCYIDIPDVTYTNLTAAADHQLSDNTMRVISMSLTKSDGSLSDDFVVYSNEYQTHTYTITNTGVVEIGPCVFVLENRTAGTSLGSYSSFNMTGFNLTASESQQFTMTLTNVPASGSIYYQRLNATCGSTVQLLSIDVSSTEPPSAGGTGGSTTINETVIIGELPPNPEDWLETPAYWLEQLAFRPLVGPFPAIVVVMGLFSALYLVRSIGKNEKHHMTGTNFIVIIAVLVIVYLVMSNMTNIPAFNLPIGEVAQTGQQAAISFDLSESLQWLQSLPQQGVELINKNLPWWLG